MKDRLGRLMQKSTPSLKTRKLDRIEKLLDGIADVEREYGDKVDRTPINFCLTEFTIDMNGDTEGDLSQKLGGLIDRLSAVKCRLDAELRESGSNVESAV